MTAALMMMSVISLRCRCATYMVYTFRGIQYYSIPELFSGH